jgi:hypothetical protein
LKLPVTVLFASDAVQFTAVSPSGKREPDDGAHVTFAVPDGRPLKSSPVDAPFTLYATTAPFAAVASAVMSAGSCRLAVCANAFSVNARTASKVDRRILSSCLPGDTEDTTTACRKSTP